MTPTIYFHGWIPVLIAIMFFNIVSCGSGSYRNATCHMGQPPYSDETCFQYFDDNLLHSYSEYDCSDEEYSHMNCCGGVCKCCEGSSCNSTCREPAISGTSSDEDSCETPVPPRNSPGLDSFRVPCNQYVKGHLVKTYSQDDCDNEEYRYMNCCDGACTCCNIEEKCSTGGKNSCNAPLKSGRGSGQPISNRTIPL